LRDRAIGSCGQSKGKDAGHPASFFCAARSALQIIFLIAQRAALSSSIYFFKKYFLRLNMNFFKVIHI
jgi:hypothetical protein